MQQPFMIVIMPRAQEVGVLSREPLLRCAIGAVAPLPEAIALRLCCWRSVSWCVRRKPASVLHSFAWDGLGDLQCERLHGKFFIIQRLGCNLRRGMAC